jgi:quercetin dioxygenase-like cupin family protein
MPDYGSRELCMKTYRWDNIPVDRITESIERQMIVGRNEMLVRWRFRKGAFAARHQHPHEQIVMMVQGKLRLIVGDAETIMGEKDIVVVPPNTPHEAHAIEETVVIDIFSPPREDFVNGARLAYLG